MALNIPKGKENAVAEKPAVEKKEAVVETAAVEQGTYGEKRAQLAFVCPLGDPSNQDTTRVKNADGTENRKVTSTIVGYKFKVLEEMQVPDCGTNEGFKKDPMNYDNLEAWRTAKKGEEIKLTPFETALLLSQPEFNGGCDGGEKPVSCVYQTKQMKAKDGQLVSASAAAATPRVSLRAINGSIKDFDIEDVLTYEKVEVNGVVRKKRTIKEGFEKWAPLAAQATRKSTGRTKSEADPTKVANKNAQAFLSFVKAKKAN